MSGRSVYPTTLFLGRLASDIATDKWLTKYNWFEVSREVDISRALSTSDIVTDDRLTTSDILGNKQQLFGIHKK